MSPRHQRFLKEVEIWRRLQHPNVTRLYGVAYFHDQVHLVSKWMEKGTAMKYIQTTPDADRRRILSEVASGMEYLHANKIVHGDLRGVCHTPICYVVHPLTTLQANVLVSSAGKSCLSDFGFSSLLEEVILESLKLHSLTDIPLERRPKDTWNPFFLQMDRARADRPQHNRQR